MDKEKQLSSEEKIMKVKTEFYSFKSETNRRLDEILEKLRPQFSSTHVTTFLLGLVGTVAGIMIYVTSIKSDARNNTTRLDNVETVQKTEKEISTLQYTSIDAKLDILLQDVAVLKAKNDEN